MALNKNQLRNREIEAIPEQIKDNLSPSEEILHQVKWDYTPKSVKIMFYFTVGMAVSMTIFLIYIFSRNNNILKEFWSIGIVAPIILITMLFTYKKVGFIREYFLVISNKKLYLYTKLGRVDLIDSIELTSIKAVILRKKRISRKYKNQGKILLISDELKESQKSRIIIQNVHNLSYHFQMIESILWCYGNLKERIELIRIKYDTNLPFTFKIEYELFQRFTRYCRIFDIFIIISSGGVVGIICIFLRIADYFELLMILPLLLMSGGTFIAVSSVYRYRFRNVLTTINNNLILEENKINLRGENFLETISFNEKIILDFSHTPDLTKFSIGSFEIIGAIIVKESIDSSRMIKFGPIFEFYKFLEVIYLHILNWKGEQGLLLSKEHFQDLKREKLREVSQGLDKELKEPKLEEIHIDNDILKQVQNYLESNEEILFKYKPIVKLNKKIIIGIIGILSFILFAISGYLTYYFLSINFFVISLIILVFPIAYGSMALCALPGILLEKKSLYIFTNQKIIVKYPKQFIIAKLNNIASIKQINKRNKYHLVINLKRELESSPFINKNNIFIQNIPMDNNLIDKLKYIREKI